jgi:colanic acid biosynthesis glycosyl transferase WcaI
LKKILLITAHFEPELTGIAVYTTDLAKYLKDKNFNLEVLTKGYSESSDVYPDFKVTRVTLSKRLAKKNTNWFVSALLELELLCKFRKQMNSPSFINPDIVISVVPSISSGLAARALANSTGVKHLLIFQDLSWLGAGQIYGAAGSLLSKIIFKLERRIFHSASQIVGISPEIVQHFQKFGLENSQKVSMIYNYSIMHTQNNIDFRKANSISEEKYLVMHTGNMGRKQGLENILETAKILNKETDIIFFLIGGGNQEKKLKSSIAHCENIKVLSYVKNEEYLSALNSADLLLINEISTQLGMSLPSKLTSYFQADVAILASVPLTGPTANFLHGKSHIVEAMNPMELAKKILEIRSDPTLSHNFIERAKEFCLYDLSAEIGRSKYLEIIDDLSME